MDAGKRSYDNYDGGALVKRARFDDEDNGTQQLVVSSDGKGKGGQLVAAVRRTSGLQAPIMQLAGHDAEVLDIAVDPTGEILASASVDKCINLWKVYGTEDSNFGSLRGQKGAITSVAFPSTGNHLFAGSTDKTVATYDISNGALLRRNRGHTEIVNCVDVTRGGGKRELIASASDDGLIKIWDIDTKSAIDEVELSYPVTAVRWSEDGQQLFIGGIDNDIHVSGPIFTAANFAKLVSASASICARNRCCIHCTDTTTLSHHCQYRQRAHTYCQPRPMTQ